MSLLLRILLASIICSFITHASETEIKELDDRTIYYLEKGTVTELASACAKITDINKVGARNWLNRLVTPLDIAVQSSYTINKFERIQWLLDHNATITDKALYYLIENNIHYEKKHCLAVLHYLLQHPRCPRSTYALHRAVESQNFPAVNLLLQTGTDPNATNDCNETPIKLCAEHSNSSILELLISQGARIDNYPILHAQAGNKFGYKIIKWLFKHQAIKAGTINEQHNFNGFTPLHNAAYSGYYKTGYALLAYPLINTQIKDNDGLTPFDLAKWATCLRGPDRKQVGRVLARYKQIKHLMSQPSWGNPFQFQPRSIPIQLPGEVAAIIAYHATEEIVSHIDIEEGKKVHKNKVVNLNKEFMKYKDCTVKPFK